MKKLLTSIIVLLMPLIAWGDYYGSWAIDDYVTFTANLHSAATGAETAADGDVDLWIYEDDSATQIVDTTMDAFDAITGLYEQKVQLTAAAGFEVGKHYTALVRATVGGIAGHTTHNFQILANVNVEEVLNATPLSQAKIQEGLILLSSTIASVTTADTVFRLTSGENVIDDIFNDKEIVIQDDENPTRITTAKIIDYDASSREVTVESDPTPGAWTLDAGDKVWIRANITSSGGGWWGMLNDKNYLEQYLFANLNLAVIDMKEVGVEEENLI